MLWFLQSNSLGSLGEDQAVDIHIEACRAISRVPYWSREDAAELPAFVAQISQLFLESVQGLSEAPAAGRPQRRVLDLNEAEEVAATCSASLLHLMLSDPCPPAVQSCLVESLGAGCRAEGGEVAAAANEGSESAVNHVMKVMQVFPSSDRLQMNCQHLLTSLLDE